MAGYGEWTKAPPVRDFFEPQRLLTATSGDRRHAGATRPASKILTQQRVDGTAVTGETGDKEDGEFRRTISRSKMNQQEGEAARPKLPMRMLSMERLKSGSDPATFAEVKGARNKRELEDNIHEVIQSPHKKSKMVENEGSSSQGCGGWPSTATRSP
ncbi:hypothetical protein ACFX12_027170 [Malus domestica]